MIGPEKHPIKAHRVILASASDFFKAMFTTDLKEGTQSEIELPKTDIATMKALIEFAYTGKIQVTESNIENIITAANFYGMSTLVQKCVKYIMGRINNSNSIEILEFAERISNNDLKDFAMRFVVQNFEDISSKNLDVMEMTTEVLMGIIEHSATSIHQDPTENEERLFQLGWNHLQSKSEDVWQKFLPRLLEVVHLPRVSDQFLKDLTRKVGHNETANKLIERAKQIKSTFTHYLTSTKKPDDDVKTVKWAMGRFGKSGTISVQCDGLKNDTSLEWMGVPAYIKGIPWCLLAKIETVTDDGPPLNYLATYLTCMTALKSESIPCNAEITIIAPKTSNHTQNCDIGEFSHTFVANANTYGFNRSVTLTEVMAEYYDDNTKSCTVKAHVTMDCDAIFMPPKTT